MRLERFKTSSGVMDYLASLFELERLFGVQVVDRPHSYCLLHQIAIFFAGSECNNLASPSSSPSPFRSVNCNDISILHFQQGASDPIWSSGQDPALSPPWPGFDSRCGKYCLFLGGILQVFFCFDSLLSTLLHENP